MVVARVRLIAHLAHLSGTCLAAVTAVHEEAHAWRTGRGDLGTLARPLAVLRPVVLVHSRGCHRRGWRHGSGILGVDLETEVDRTWSKFGMCSSAMRLFHNMTFVALRKYHIFDLTKYFASVATVFLWLSRIKVSCFITSKVFDPLWQKLYFNPKLFYIQLFLLTCLSKHWRTRSQIPYLYTSASLPTSEIHGSLLKPGHAVQWIKRDFNRN